MGSLILAVRFLTIVPVPGRDDLAPSALGRAAWWFPVVGLALGVLLAGAGRFLDHLTPPLISSTLLVAGWKIATGGIHLDGLADSLDGLAGSSQERRLAIMQDSRIGVFGAVGLVLVLVLFVAAVLELPEPVRARLLVLAPMVGRVTPLLAASWLPPATPGRGLGAAFASGLSPWAALALGIGSLLLAAWLLGPLGPAIVVAAWVAALLWAAFVARRLGGITGDVLGAVVELGELGALVSASVATHRGWL